MSDYCYDGQFDLMCHLLDEIKNILIEIRDKDRKIDQMEKNDKGN